MHKAFKAFGHRASQQEVIETLIDELIQECDMDGRPEAEVFSEILRAAKRRLFPGVHPR